MKYISVDTLVIGSGIAGLLACKMLSEKNISVLIVSDTACLGGGASYFPLKATLGIQVTANSNNDKDLFTEDFLRTGHGLVETTKMNAYIKDSSHNVELLNKIGLKPYLRNDTRPACFAKYSRPVHLITDWKKSQEYIKDDFAKSENITTILETKVIKLFSKDNTIVGALLYSNDSYILVNAKVVILATGGIAGLYKDNLYPKEVDGSGWSLASDIGAKLINTEFIQFIPSFIKPNYKALFGEHTIKYLKNVFDDKGNDIFFDLTDEEKHQLFLERSSYAPFSSDFNSSLFDIRIFNAIENGSKGVVFTYKDAIYDDKEAFFTIYLDWLTNEQKINLVNDKIVISHFAHASNGGLEIDDHGETSVHNLYALGEASCGVEGANRMGGNSVGGIIVFVPRAIDRIHKNILKIEQVKKEFFDSEVTSFFNSVKCETKLSAKMVLEEIEELLQTKASIVRSNKQLSFALKQLHKLESSYGITKENETLEGYRAYHAIKASIILVKSMLSRKQSLGSHFIM